MRLTAFRSAAETRRVALPFAAFLVHASLFGTWIVDDAGISFAYARNLASGDGLVCQPGNRVEGYSNFLWVATLVPFFLTKAFDPVWTPKALSVLCMLGTFLVAHHALSRTVPWGSTVAISGLTLASLQTGFVVWSVSGLENALYVLLLVSLMAGGLRCGRNHGPGTAAALGCAVAAAAMTRPEGVVYVAAYPLWLLARRLLVQDTDASTDVGKVGAYALGFVIPLGCFLAFRWWYFADAMPNTYYAKGGPTLDDVVALLTLGGAMSAKLFHLMVSVGGSHGAVVLVPALVVASLVIALKRQAGWVHVVTGTLLAISTVAYLLLPGDWMPESRFATPFYMFLYLYGAAVAWSITSGLGRSAAGRHGVFSLTIVLLALATVWLVQERSRAFAARPTLPLRSVERSAQRFERYAAILSVESASLLAPDIGGPVFSGRLKIYDLAGLCDRVIARSLGNGSRQQSRQRFYDYVFEEAKPTFITMHTAWTRLAKLNHDSRFTRDYVAIASYPVDTSSEHEGVTLESGHFVRRDVLRGRSDLLDLIRQWERSPGRDEGRVREERRTAQ